MLTTDSTFKTFTRGALFGVGWMAIEFQIQDTWPHNAPLRAGLGGLLGAVTYWSVLPVTYWGQKMAEAGEDAST